VEFRGDGGAGDLSVIAEESKEINHMPIKPRPITYECPTCGWSKTVAPHSDCLIIGRDGFDTCPKCGDKNLALRSANLIERFLLGFSSALMGR
jgi:predicted RNA-binding Zn-ribbon protein involved in translation (DUF1610 family)